MAQKRMFDKRITDSDRFIDLPNSTKALYFMAGMNADDRGFFQPRKLQKECGFTDDDYKILIAKKFFITFESGVMVITDWAKNNYLDGNRLTETEYVDELKMLEVINGKYELKPEALMLNGSVKPVCEKVFNQNSIVENSIEYIPPITPQGEGNEYTSSVCEIVDYLNEKTKCSYKANTKATRNHIIARLKEGYSVDDFKKVIRSKTEDWGNDTKMQQYLRPNTLFASKFESYLQQALQKEQSSTGYHFEIEGC